MSTGTAGCTRVKRSSSGDPNIGGEARSSSVLSIPERLSRGADAGKNLLLVDPVAAHDAAVHGLHGAVHVPVGLEDPAHLAPGLRGGLRHVEVLDVERRGDPRVLEGGLDA